ncbi:VCBS domain-containing protein, partial [bacterium]|nr:VCBS domain-containing protein [bacterium]
MTNSLPALGFKKYDKKVSGKHSGTLFILTLILALASPCQLRAAEVTNNSDEGAGSLRQAVADAEAGEIITFSDSFTITLASPITIDKDIVIDGGNSVTISGGELTSIFKINSPTRHVVYDGYVYRTLLGADINGRTQYGITEQTAAPMPDGFEVAPDSEDIVQNVIAPYYWDIWRLCTENKCWATKNYGASAGVVKDNLRNWEQIENGDYRVKAGNNYYRLLIRADVSQFTPSGVVIKNITLKDGLAKGGDGERAGRLPTNSPGGGGAGMGGAIAIWNGSVDVNGVTFTDNKAVGGNGGANPHVSANDGYGGAGGSSVFGGGAARKYWGSGRSNNGGFGGGGSGNNGYNDTATTRAGGNGGFGGGGGGGEASDDSVYPSRYRIPAGNGGVGGMFAGNGSTGGLGNAPTHWSDGYDPAPGTGGGGAGLGGAIFIKAGTLTVKNSSFESNEAQGGLGGTGAHSNISNGEPGQGAGGAIFVYQDATFNSWGGVSYSGNTAQTSDANYYIMEGAEYDTAPPVLAGTFNGEVTEGNEGDVSDATGTISITDADADDNPSFEDVELSGNHGTLVLAGGTWTYTLDQVAAQAFQQGDLREEKITLSATDGTQQLITITINGANDAPVGVVATAGATEDGDTLTGQLSSTDADVAVFATNTYSVVLNNGEELNVFSDNDGSHSWLLVGRGREGWEFDADGQGALADIGNSATLGTSAAFSPAMYPDALINEFISRSGVALTDIEIRLKRAGDPAGTTYQEVRWRPKTQAVWRSNFDTAYDVEKEIVAIGGATGDQLGIDSDSNTRDKWVTGTNDADRIMTRAWDGHANKKGFSYGSLVTNGANNSTSFLWENADENHAISYTEVYIRRKDSNQSLLEKLVKPETFEQPAYLITKGVAGLVIAQDGSYTFDPSHSNYQSLAEGETQELVAEWTVTDANGGSSASTLTITVTGTNDAPVSVAANGEAVEDGDLLSGQLSVTDLDGNSTYTYALAEPVAGLTLNQDGSYSFDASGNDYQSIPSGQVRDVVASWVATGGNGDEAVGSLTLKITGANLSVTPATANAIEGGVIVNGQLVATDDNGAALSYSLAEAVAGLTINSDGSYQFDPRVSAYDSLPKGGQQEIEAQWNVSDPALNDSLSSTLKITLTGTNDAPVAVAATNEASTEVAEVILDPNSFDLIWENVNDPNDKAIMLTLTDAGGSNVNWSFSGSAIAPSGTTADGARSKIALPNSNGFGWTTNWTKFSEFTNFNLLAPVSTTGTYQVHVNSALVGDARAVGQVGNLKGGTFFISAGGSNMSFPAISVNDTISIVGSGTFDVGSGTFASNFNIGQYTSLEAPLGGGVILNVSSAGVQIVSAQLVANDVDQNSVLGYSLDEEVPGLTLSESGAYSFDPSDAAYQFLPTGETLEVVAPWTVEDEHGASDSSNLTITVTGTSDAPLTKGAIDGDGDTLTGQLENPGNATGFALTKPASGLTINGDGGYSFDPSAGSFDGLKAGQTSQVIANWKALDGNSAEINGAILITVTGVNDAPVAVAAVAAVTEDDVLFSGQLVATDPDQDAVVTFALAGEETVAGLAINEGGGFSFDPANTAYQDVAQGADRVVVANWVATDELGAKGPGTLTITVTGVNDGPIAVMNSINVTEGGDPLPGTLVANDVDQGAVVTYALVENVAGLAVSEDGSFTFDPANAAYQALAQGESQEVVANWVATDDQGAKANGALTITVAGSNNSPVTNPFEGLAAAGQLIASDSDNGSSLVYSLNGAVEGLTINADGSYGFDLTLPAYRSLRAGETLVVEAGWTATDNNEASTSSTLKLALEGVNDAPEPVPATAAATEDSSAAVTGQLSATDADANAVLTYALDAPVAGLTIDEEGAFSFELPSGSNQSLALGQTSEIVANWTVTDDAEATGNGTLTITVNGSNDAPVGVDASVEVPKGLVASGKTLVLDMYIGGGRVKATITLPDESEWRDGDMIELMMPLNRENFKLSSPQFSPELVDYLEEKFNFFGDFRMIGDDRFMPGGDEIWIGMLMDFRLMLDGPLFMFIHRFGDGDIEFWDPELRDLFEESGFFTFDRRVEVDDRARLEDATSSITSGSLAATDVDQNSVLTFALDEPVAGLTLNTNGNYTFDGNNQAYADLWEGDSREVVANWTVTDQHGATDSRKLTITVKGNGVKPDTDPPVITLVGEAELVLEAALDGTYTDPGVACQDEVDGDLAASVVVAGDPVDLKVPGSYVVTYNCQDAAGNPAVQVTRTIVVSDTTKPVITLVGNAETTAEAGSQYQDAGATAIDSLDGEVAVTVVNNVDTNSLGSYTVEYSAKDNAENAVSVTRTVVVKDTTKPVITLVGAAQVTLKADAEVAYVDLGATCADGIDGDLGSRIQVGGDVVNRQVPGSYTVTYNCQDLSGNAADQVSRLVIIYGVNADFSNKNLVAIDFSGADLSGVSFANTNLQDANFANANLSGVNFKDANLSGAKLDNVNLSNADLSNADLSNAFLLGASSGGIVGSPMDIPYGFQFARGYLIGPGVNLAGADLAGLFLDSANLSLTNLSGANLAGASFPFADLVEANLAGADLTGATLTGANLDRATLVDATLTNTNFTDSYLGGANLSGAKLIGANFISTNLLGANLTGADLKDANLVDSNFLEANFSGISSGGITGTGSTFPQGFKLVNFYLVGPKANLSGADIGDANLTGINLNGANLAGSNLAGALLDQAQLGGANLTGANLSGASLVGATLKDANFTDANLGGTILEGIVIGESNGSRIAELETQLAQAIAEREARPTSEALATAEARIIEVVAERDARFADTDGDGLTDVKEIELETKADEITAFHLQDYLEVKVAEGLSVGEQNVSADPAKFGLITINAYDAMVTQMEEAIAQKNTEYIAVVAERDARPTLSVYDAAVADSRAAGQADVTTAPASYSLTTQASYDTVVAERDARFADTDGDGLTDLREIELETDPDVSTLYYLTVDPDFEASMSFSREAGREDVIQSPHVYGLTTKSLYESVVAQ